MYGALAEHTFFAARHVEAEFDIFPHFLAGYGADIVAGGNPLQQGSIAGFQQGFVELYLPHQENIKQFCDNLGAEYKKFDEYE